MKLRKILFILSTLFIFSSCMEELQDMLSPNAELPTETKIYFTNNTSSEVNLILNIIYPNRANVTYTISVNANASKEYSLNLKTIYTLYSNEFPNSENFSLNLQVVDDANGLTPSGYNSLTLSSKSYTLDKNAVTISESALTWTSKAN